MMVPSYSKYERTVFTLTYLKTGTGYPGTSHSTMAVPDSTTSNMKVPSILRPTRRGGILLVGSVGELELTGK
jgi:hypothetical protein